MYRTNFFCLLILISVFVKVKSTSPTTTTILSMLTSEEIPSSCSYCQTMACRCSSKDNILNCSSYLLNLTFAPNCAEMKIWERVDFSSRNLESFDSSRLLSLRMRRLLLKSNLITNIQDETFDSVGDILIELDLQMNQLSNLSPKWLNSKLIGLKILNLASNQLESFAYLDQIHLPQLQELNLSCNQIEIFPNQINQWKSLIKLDLSFNKLSSIPRFAFKDLQNLSWLSLASNRHLTCIIQDSFKHLKSLKYLDLSSTNLLDLDGCIFFQLTHLHTLKIERMSINCSSCWLSIARKNSIKLIGQCLNNITVERLESLTNEQIRNSCPKSSIDCSVDSCEPDSFDFEQKSYSSSRSSISSKDSNSSKNRTVEIILAVIFSLIAVLIIIIVIIFIYRWRNGKKLFCCDFLPTTTSTMTRRTQRHHQKQIIDTNPTVIESVVTHGGNMNIPSYSHQNNVYNHESTSNTKRKLYNPMFSDSPASDIRHHQIAIESNDHI